LMDPQEEISNDDFENPDIENSQEGLI